MVDLLVLACLRKPAKKSKHRICFQMVLIGASHLGSRKEVLEMLNLAGEKGIESWVEEIPISEQGLKEAVTRLKKNDVRYRFTLTGYDAAFKA
jgi:alcohol dehydrogenase (NADP+)